LGRTAEGRRLACRLQGVVVQCYNLSQEPGAFMSTAIVRRTLQAEGPACLPLGLLNGRVIFRRQYPKR
jgi:hypothetical protein